ncbi:FecR domain-containing protein [Echinicola marina]|uniref:FecR family protein n=1 Tax=Echinicola marina TaxID=2859768 RepID=UPI001CF6B54E|nr:FecR family protein [Echinicola marina]UCS92200.1 FecR domain-containing protein [Echinicola marina]
MKYSEFNIIDFLQDEFFINWVNNPTHETNHFWVKWLVEHPEKREEVFKASQIIKLVDYKKQYEIPDDIYLDMYENIKLDKHTEPYNDPSKLVKWRFWNKLVAAVLVLGCIFWGYNNFNGNKSEQIDTPNLITKSNPCGQKSKVLLPDGTKVYLNAESSLVFPVEFSDSLRLVKLKGEAFFDVKESKVRPFVVQADNTRVRVMGTTFNVKNKEGLSVALVSGKVAVENDLGTKIILSPQEKLEIDESGNFYKSSFDLLETTGWKNKYLVFKEDNYDEVKEKLETWFGVKIINRKEMEEGWSYSGVYHNESLENVLEGISITSNFTFRIEDKTILIENPK